MSERIMPGLGLRAFYAEGQAGWGTPLSEDLRALSVLVQARALSRSTALPGSGSAGDVCIVPDWAGAHADDLALWDGPAGSEAWVFLTPQPGWTVWVEDETAALRWSGSAWEVASSGGGDSGVVDVRVVSAAHALELADVGAILLVDSGSAVTVTIPVASAVAFPVGATLAVSQLGAGAVSIAAAAGVSLNGEAAGSVGLIGPFAGASLVCRGPDDWLIQGALDAPAMLGETTVQGDLTVTGALSKGSGSFRIDHPLMPATHWLVHSFVEAPGADLVYSGMAVLSGGRATVNIDAAAGMTPGTFAALARSVRRATSNETGFAPVRAALDGAVLSIDCADPASTDTVFWMVVAERRDAHMRAASWTDDAGRVIVEPLKPGGAP